MDNFRNSELGTHRNHRTPAALEASHVMLDDSSPTELLREAIALAKQLRFVSADVPEEAAWPSILQNAKADWAGFLGEDNGEILAEFQRFFANPGGYVPPVSAPLSRPHVALFGAFIHILHHARTEINAFTQRHLDHYIHQELTLKPLPTQPAEVFVTLGLKAGAPATIVPDGSQLHAPKVDETVAFATEGDIEVHAGTLSQISSLHAAFEAAGLRKKLDPKAVDGGMAAIRALIWQSGYQSRVPLVSGNSFEAILALLNDREKRRDFPAEVLQVTLDEFRKMMGLSPDQLPMTVEEEVLFQKWESFYARMVICANYPQPQDAIPSHEDHLVDKLSKVLNNGLPLPDYKGLPVNVRTLYLDVNQTDSADDLRAGLGYMRHVLFLEETELQQLHDMGESKQGLPKMPAALVEAVIRKAATLEPNLLRQRTTRVVGTVDAKQVHRSPVGSAGGWFPYGDLADAPDTGLSGLGLLIESPVMAMAEGDRKIVLTLDFAPHNFTVLRSLFDLSPPSPKDWYSPFRFFVSTEKDWLELNWSNTVPKFTALTRQVEFTLDIPATLPSITGPGEKFPDALLIGKAPLLNLRLSQPKVPAFPPTQVAHDLFCQSLSLLKVHLKVTVEGLREFVAENQQGLIKTSAPFEPFGNAPGPSTEFMIAHPEISLKQVEYLDFKMEWMNLPASLKDYYDPYFVEMGSSPAITNKPHATSDFKASLELVTGRWTSKMGTADVAFLVPSLRVPTTNIQPITERFSAEEVASWGRPSHWKRYYRFVYSLGWDPQQEYERAVRRLSTAMAVASNNFASIAAAYVAAPTAVVEGKTNTVRYNEASQLLTRLSQIMLEPPVVPKLKQLSLGYSAQVHIPLVEWSPDAQRVDRLYHQLPFGHRLIPSGMGIPQRMLPSFEMEGNVMLGFDHLDGTEALSLLIRVQAGSGNPDQYPPAIQWSYLGLSGWRQLPSHYIYLNETNGLTQTGLLRVMLPPDATRSVAEMPSRLHWVMASAAGASKDLPDWQDAHLHALRARQIVGSETKADLWYFPEGSVSALERNFPTIETVTQPYPSMGGRAAEPQAEFYRRVSERLRHKNRAVTAWDFEHLCLAQFPELFAVKAIPAIAAPGRQPGEMSVVVVPDLRLQEFSDPFQPRFGFGELHVISSFLSSRAPMFATISARNPVYRPVVVGTTLNFKEGYSSAACKHRVQERLKEYLAPWAFEKATEMAFGGRLYVSEIVDFLQSEPYVSFVGKTRLFVGDAQGVYTEATGPDGDSSVYIEVAQTDVLTSAQSHLVNEIGKEDAQNEIWEGISWMVIHQDFKLKYDPNTPPEIYEEWNGISWVVVSLDLKAGDSNQ